MNETGLLAHLRDYFHVPPENLATETLAYILKSSEPARSAFNDFLQRAQPELPRLLWFDTQDTSSGDSGIPDLVGFPEAGDRPFLGEVKFDAGLTSHQPVSYIHTLQNRQAPGLLLFIVPESRVHMVWIDVRRRCSAAGFELSTERSDRLPIISASVDDRVTIGLTSWKEVLNVLDFALQEHSCERSLWDLRQLQAMCDRQDREAFVPLTSQDLDSRAGQRGLDFVDLTLETIETIVAEGTAKHGGNASFTREWGGRYVLLENWSCYLGVSWRNWASQRPTPIWLMITDLRAYSNEELSEALTPLKMKDPPLLLVEGGRHVIPIYLKEGVDRDTVREDMVRQVSEVAALLSKCPPPDPEQSASLS